MERFSPPLVDARFLLARVGTTSPPGQEEIAALRDRLATMRAHPACGVERAEQLSGALLILDVLALAGEDTPLEAIAG